MSYSSIEVMNENAVQMVLMGPEDTCGEKEPDFHTLAPADPNSSSGENVAENPEEQEIAPEFQEEIAPMVGAIIFSPQDMITSTRSTRGRGRGRAKGRPDALTIKIEEGVDYSRIDVPVACEICGKVVANGKTLVQHMSTHSDVKPLQCPHCPKSFARMVHLQGHLVLHGIEKQFECPTCHQRFSRQDCVKVHMRLHDKSKCVFCKVCHKAFLTLGALNIHMRIHRGEKPFKCHLCGKCFTQKNHVITHIKRHTKVSSAPFSKKLGPRMFQCEHCPRSFIRMSDYERHVQWNHGAVTDTSLADRFPTIGNVSLEEKSSPMLPSRFPSTGDITMNNRVRKKSIRKVMCSTGTQTDQEGGHVIIPRQYQNATSMTTTSTQVSAPPTPRPTDDELYENDIFDEGMDRNYSSDEDDLEGEDAGGDHEGPTYQESETTMVSFIRDGASTSATDDAFDAIIGKAKPDLIKREVAREDLVLDSSPCEDEDRDIQSELAAEYAKREESLLAPQTPVSESVPSVNPPEKPLSFCSHLGLKSEERKIVEEVESEQEDEGQKVMSPKSQENTPSQQSQSVSPSSSQPMPPPPRPPGLHPNMPRPTTKILDNFNTKNWRGRGRARGRGRGRGRSKSFMGLTGATHLRLIRKSMINFISEKNEQMNCTEKSDEVEFSEESSKVEEDQFADAETASLDKRVKRQPKARQHGTDFVCDVKSCETCNPVKEDLEPLAPEVQQPVQLPKRTITTTSQPNNQLNSVKDQSAKLLQFLISGDESNLQGTDFKIISDVKETQLEAKRMKLDEISGLRSWTTEGSGSFSSFTGMKSERTDYFTPVSSSSQDDFISPPVELQAFCIPTYSCKLCGREFRFEGKLHRHIESVHQKKAIFSPDVKPGRVSRDLERDYLTILEKELIPSISPPPVTIKKPAPKNPEIEALRSEWDDDDDDNNDDDEDEASQHFEEERAITQITQEHLDDSTISSFKENTSINVRPSNTKDMVNMSDSLSDIYVSGVKVNINKISGLAGSDLKYSRRKQDDEGLSSRLTSAKPQVKPPSSLEIKCRKLLEKLFDHTLLIECGLFQEHVSVVLGRLLQHYGVKNIEDYGQGQYEVLKYNLWRLIEWKVTMEQMEEFYTDGKSVEEMMDDIMNGRVPIIAHHELHQEPPVEEPEPEPAQPPPQPQTEPIQAMEAVHLSEGQLMLSQVTNVLGGQLNLGEGVTQVVLAQDVSPEMLQGAHIVTIDPTTGQVLSQVTADQVILADSLGEDINHQIQSMDGHVVVSHSSPAPTVVSALPPGSILASSSGASHISASMHSDQIVNVPGTIIKMEAVPHSTHSSL